MFNHLGCDREIESAQALIAVREAAMDQFDALAEHRSRAIQAQATVRLLKLKVSHVHPDDPAQAADREESAD